METNHSSVTAEVKKIIIPTYVQPDAEELPMFSENRVHQRTSGRPYPCRVVLKANRKEKVDKEYTVIVLENEYIRLQVLPELGGRIYSATDKTTGYDFFYRQHVIKPALIGVLGLWISGGVEFNWPFHHRPSTFMPVDFMIERKPDGSAVAWLSEHDPMERMKGMVGICLRPGERVFETKVKICNRTEVTRSVLWWENAAVPVNENYQLFFPPDVSYVYFHNKRAVTTYPIASGVYNGIRFDNNPDISLHRNTRQPTSYFSAPSRYDFFGGYDHGKECGVVHVANHHIATGRKMFTWAYNQLSASWEQALTDTDGPYAELMAGSCSDNQPDFAWMEPFETKNFSHFWYPISEVGIPVFANENAVLSRTQCGGRIKLALQTVRQYQNARLRVSAAADGTIILDQPINLRPGETFRISYHTSTKDGSRYLLTDQRGGVVFEFSEGDLNPSDIPEPVSDLPAYNELRTPQELYLAGLHRAQYRDPVVLPDIYWKEALCRDPEYVPALLAMGDFCYRRAFLAEALSYLERARRVLTTYNSHPFSGDVFYLLGLVLLALDRDEEAYDSFYKASWNNACCSRSMTYIAAIDGRRKEYRKMLDHSAEAMRHDSENPLAGVLKAAAEYKLGNAEASTRLTSEILRSDPLNHLARYLYILATGKDISEFYACLNSSPSQTCLDLAYNLIDAGLTKEAADLLEGLCHYSRNMDTMVYYTLAYLYGKAGHSERFETAAAKGRTAQTGGVYPFRLWEWKVLTYILEKYPDDATALNLLGCLLYDKGHYEEAAQNWEKGIHADPDNYMAYRNLAVAYYSHLDRRNEVPGLLRKALSKHPGDRQLIYEISYVMPRLNASQEEKLDFLRRNCKGDPADDIRDDICIEWAKAYNRNNQPEKTLQLLQSHTFIPCEGGEHVVAEQYMFAHYNLGRRYLEKGDREQAVMHFRAAQCLPENLGAGIWHEAKLVPAQYYEAYCLAQTGETDRAQTIYRHILELSVDYFSNMHLSELPYFQALSWDGTGNPIRGQLLIRRCLHKWEEECQKKDSGYFRTTPFFVSYCEDPATARKAHYKYLIGLANLYLRDKKSAEENLHTALLLEPDNLYCWLEWRTLFAYLE